MTRWATIIAALLAAAPAGAQCLGFQCPPGVLGSGASGVTPPLAGLTAPAAAYSFRKLLSAYAGSAVKLRRTTGGTLDVGFTAGGDFDTAAATAFCLATTCFIDTWYDQSGNARHLLQATTANQPQYIANCIGTLPCAQTTTVAQGMASAGTLTPATGVASFAVVAGRSAAGYCTWLRENGVANRFSGDAVANQWRLDGGTSGSVLAAVADNAWHSVQATINGASSNITVDGATTTGTAIGSTVAGPVQIAGETTASCNFAEHLLWDNYALTAAEKTALAGNQQQYYTPLPLDTFATPAAAYSMRRLKSTYTGPAIRLRRASDNAEADINFVGFTGFTGAPIDTAAATAHCAATSCFVAKWYNQAPSGAARDALRGAAQQPALAFGCNGTLPCIRTTSGNELLATDVPHVAPVMPATFSAVANRSAGTGACYIPVQYTANNSMYTNVAPNQWGMSGGASGSILATAADNAWHSAIGIMAGASSVLRIDGAETTGTVTGSTTADAFIPIFGGAATTCSVVEVVYWGGYALTAGERAALRSNQQSFWGTP